MSKKITPMRAIRKKCLECTNGQASEVKYCLIKDCPLFAYRMGHRPQETDFNIEDEEVAIEEDKI